MCWGKVVHMCVVPEEARKSVRSPGVLADACELLVGASVLQEQYLLLAISLAHYA